MRLLTVHAHPDDEASKGAATTARYVAEGHQVRIVTCTGGERGDVLNPRLAHDPEVLANLSEVRRAEMAAAIEALGAEHVWLGFEDSGLPQGDPLPPLPEGCFALQPLEVTLPAMVRQIREFRPHVLVTYNENGGYPHPDHLMTHSLSMAALDAAADPAYQPELGEPWQTPKVYYDVSFSRARIQAAHEAIVATGGASPFEEWIANSSRREERHVSARIDVARYFPQRDAALLAHATQIDPDGFFFAMPRDLEAEVWPYEEFELVRSAVPTSEPEDDLFAGLTE